MSNVYTGAMGMINSQNKLETIGNNIANSRTTGFKSDAVTSKVFQESFMKVLSSDKGGRIGHYLNQVHTDAVYTNFEQGQVTPTGRTLDFALQGFDSDHISFFTVEKDGETLLTRDGAFQVDRDGYLTMGDGSFVLDENNRRIVIPNAESIALTNGGALMDGETGGMIARIGITSINQQNKGFLEKVGHNQFKIISGEEFIERFGPSDNLLQNYDENVGFRRVFPNRAVVEQLAATGQVAIFEQDVPFVLIHGSLEASNVDTMKEMTDMLMAQRGFQASAKVLQTFDKINEKDANQLGN